MKTFYIILEQQGWAKRAFTVKAEDADEAYEKVKEELFNEYESFAVSKEDFNQILKNDNPDLVEIDGDDEDEDEDNDEEVVDYPDDFELYRPGWCDTEKQVENYISETLEELFHREVADCVYEFDYNKIYVSEIIWGEKK